MGQPNDMQQTVAQQTHIEIKPDGFGLRTDAEGWVVGGLICVVLVVFLRSPLAKAIAATIEGGKKAVKKSLGG